jgi:methylenetetrahydrofolate reductase (NADPH)
MSDPTTRPGQLQGALEAGTFAITAEITPPASCNGADLLAKALPLRGLAEAVNVTDGASARAHLSSITSAGLLVANGVEPVLQLTCRDRNRIALQSELMAAAALGVRNLLVLTGDDPKAGDQPETKPVFDLDSRGLLDTARILRDRGELPNGRKIAGHADFFLGGADAPIDPKPDWHPKSLAGKIEGGAQFAQTQFCMDLDVVGRYAAHLRQAGLLDKIHLLIGIAPLASARSGRWMRENLFGTIIPDHIIERMDRATNPKAEGQAICIELLEGLAAIPGIAGAHIMAPLNEAAIPNVIRAVSHLRGRKG